MTRSRSCGKKEGGKTVELPAEDCGGGEALQTLECNRHKCAVWSEWGDWGCPTYCGLSYENRARTCVDTEETGPAATLVIILPKILPAICNFN